MTPTSVLMLFIYTSILHLLLVRFTAVVNMAMLM